MHVISICIPFNWFRVEITRHISIIVSCEFVAINIFKVIRFIMNLIAYNYSFFDLISHIPCIQKTFFVSIDAILYNYVNEPKIITITGVMVAILQWKGVPEKLHRYFLAWIMWIYIKRVILIHPIQYRKNCEHK